MITTITLNPCIDKTVTISNFKAGALNRIESSRVDMSGKGINVAVAFSNLGGEAKCTGFNFLDNKWMAEDCLEGHGIEYKFVNVPGEVRTNLKIFDPTTHTMTEVNESGRFVSEEYVRELKEVLRELCAGSGAVIMSGSVPPGPGTGIYKELITCVNDSGIRAMLDAEKDFLREGIKAKPYMIKPNLYELETLVGKSLGSEREIVFECRKIIEDGVSVVCVTLGEDGGIICSGDEAYRAKGVKVEARGLQGAGDSMMAGMMLAYEEGLGIDRVLAYGTAAAAASVSRPGTELCTREDFDKLLNEVCVSKII